MAEGKRKINWTSELVSLAIVLAAVTCARSSLADHYYVPSGSMEYSLMPGDRVIVDKTAYGVRIPLTKIDMFGAATPRRGDIAALDGWAAGQQGAEPGGRRARPRQRLLGRGEMIVRGVGHGRGLFWPLDLVERGPDPYRWRGRIDEAHRDQ